MNNKNKIKDYSSLLEGQRCSIHQGRNFLY